MRVSCGPQHWILALVGFCALCLSCVRPSLPSSVPHPLLGQTIAPVRESTLDGRLLAFPKPGSVTVIDFWATWCRPCLKIMPAIEQLWAEQHGAGLEVVGVAVDDTPGLVIQAIRRLGVTYPNVLDSAGQVRGAFKVGEDLPQSFVIDRRGKVRFTSRGGADGETDRIRAAVITLLAEEAP
ncbi:MAG: TlpA family protein disulfide reductase [Deltaproteobacteria bacterium]|nr:TlpA family protein disulfide reductase [Deltaproteobacteria bacterium]